MELPFTFLTAEEISGSIQSTFRYLKMHSKRRYKISVCSGMVILEGTLVFSKSQGLEYYFSENFRWNLTYYESETFSDSLHYHIFE